MKLRRWMVAAAFATCGRSWLPLSTPALATLAVYTFLSTYNQYYWPLLITDNTAWRTTQVGITIFRNAEYQVFNLQLAANLIVMLPTLVLLDHRAKAAGARPDGGRCEGISHAPALNTTNREALAALR